ncbi:MAG: hypothetical protein PQJ59_06035 [Spirochaetales bacterium]|nr:hypothetical protein [Spirochaetales bacterium]
MKKNLLLVSIVLLFVTGCVQTSISGLDSENFFDQEIHDTKYAQWLELDINNYSFTYTRARGQNPDCDEIGNISVVDGVSRVTFSLPEGLEGMDEEEILSTTEYTYPDEEDALKSIEEVFQSISNAYEDNNEDDSSTFLSVEYDDSYPIPIAAKEYCISPSEVDGLSSYSLELSNFLVELSD